jgi:hypothetical protein
MLLLARRSKESTRVELRLISSVADMLHNSNSIPVRFLNTTDHNKLLLLLSFV